MADSSNQIGILFGVLGGADVAGESGQRIAKQLQDLSKHLKVEVTGKLNIAETKKQLQENLKNLTLNFDLTDKGDGGKKTTKNLDNITQKVKQAKVQLESLGASFTNRLNANDKSFDVRTFQRQVEATQRDYKVLFDSNGEAFINKSNVKQAEEYLQRVKSIRTESQLIGNLNKNNVAKDSKGLSSAKLANNTSSYLQKYGYTLRSNATNEYLELKRLLDDLNAGKYNGRESVAKKQLEELQIKAREAGGEVETVGQKMRNTFGEKLYYGLMAVGALYARQALQQIYQNIVDIDTAMTELKKVTDETDIAYSRFLDNATERAQKLGTTIADTVTATADYSRLGFSMDEASELADASIVYKNVGDGIEDISDASESIISTLKAFDIEAKDVMEIVDIYNQIGNRFAISSAGVGEALKRSASSLYTAGASVQEAAAMAAAMNTTVQDADKVGTVLKTTSMYLRAAKTDAEAAGESTDGMASSISELRGELKALTGVDIMQDENTFKGVFQAYSELAEVWNSGNLTDVSKANILELLGGKRNADALSGMLNNWEIAEKALVEATNSSGSALAENEKYLDSINGKTQQLKATFESVSLNFLDSETVKGFIDTLNKLLQVVEKITSDKFGTINLISGLVGGIGLTSNKTGIGFKPKQLESSLSQAWKDLKIVHEYNKAAAKGTVPLDLQNKLLDETSERMQNLAVDANGAKVSFGAYNKSLIQSGVSLVANTAKTIALTAASTALNAAISMGISLLIQLAVAGIQKFIEWIPTTEHLAERLSKVNDELATLKSEAETLNDELKTTKDRIAELENKGNLTLVEENELTRARQLTSELERQAQLKQDEIDRKVREQKTETQKYVDNITTGIDNLSDYVDYYKSFDDIEKLNKKKDKITKDYNNGSYKYDTSKYDNAYEAYQDEINSIDGQIDALEYKMEHTILPNTSEEVGIIGRLKAFSPDSDEYEEELSKLEQAINKEDGVQDQLQAIWDTGYVYGSDKEMDGYIDKLNEIIDLYQVYAGEYSTLWGNLLNRGQFAGAREALESLGDGLNPESLKGLMESDDAVASLMSYLSRIGMINWNDILGADVFVKADKNSDGYLDTTEMLTLEQDELAKGLSGVANQFKNVADEAEKATPTLKQYADEYNRIVGYGTKGNVDYNKRPVVTDKEMVNAGWTDFPDGDWATTFDMDYGLYKPDSEEIGYTVKITPILENGKILTPEELDSYVYDELQSIIDNGGSYQDLLDYDKSHYGLIIHSAIGEVDFSALDDQLYDIKSKHLDTYMQNVADSIKNIATSLESCTERKDEIADMMAELRDDGKLSNDSMLKLFEKFSGVDGFNYYIAALTNTNATIKEQKQILNDLMGAYIDSSGILDDVTDETYEYAVAQLKALGVTNATDLATAGLLNTLINTAGATGELNAETETIIKNKLLESGATKQVANDYINAAKQVAQAQYNMSQALSEQTKNRIKNMGFEIEAIASTGDAYKAMWDKVKLNHREALVRGKYKSQDEAIKAILGEDVYNAMLKAGAAADAKAELDAILAKVGYTAIDTTISPTDKSSSSSKDPHTEAFDNWYAELKYKRDNNLISEEKFLQDLDYKYQNHFADRSKYLEEYAKYSQEVYEGFKKLYQDDLNAQKEALEEQKDDLKELADARKEALDDAKDEEDYNKEQSEKRDEINKLKVLIASFRGTLSLSSQKKLRELQQELAEKEEELAEFESDKALERAKDNIDKEYEEQEKQINAKIENIESLLEKVSDDLPEIRNAVISFAKQYGVTITSAYATGTNSSLGGLSLTQERGAELIAANVRNGQFTMLTPKSKVWNASATQALYQFANSPEAFVGGVMDKISAFKNKAMSMFYSQPVNVSVGDVIVHGNADNKTVQQIKQGQKEQVAEFLKEFKKLQ